MNTRCRKARIAAAALAAVLAAPALAGETAKVPEMQALYNPSTNASLVLRATFLHPNPIGALQNADTPGSVANDRKIPIGGVFSGLYRDPSDPFLTFWAVTDRGPNQELDINGQTRRTFPVPDFSPTIVFFRVQAGADSPAELKVYEPKPIKTTSGAMVTGLPNRPGVDEVPYDYTGTVQLPYNMDGLDSEGIVRAPNGDLWICDEYAPSVLKVGIDGVVKVRYVPVGSGISGTRYPTQETLPAVFAKRRANRGLESVAISKDGSKVFTVIQSPLSNPDTATAQASRIYRMLVLDAGTGQPTAEYVIVAETGESFGERQRDMKVSGLTYINPTTLLLLERTDPKARVYTISLAGATNILGTKWDDVATAPSLEKLTPAELATNGITPVGKSELIDLNAVVPDLPQKIEGMTLADKWTLVVGNDNDFDIAGFDGNGDASLNGVRCELLFIRLPQALVLE